MNFSSFNEPAPVLSQPRIFLGGSNLPRYTWRVSVSQSLFATYSKALSEKDVDLFVSLFDEDFLLFDVWDQWSMYGLDNWKAGVTDWFGSLGTETAGAEFEIVKEVASAKMVSISAFVTFSGYSAEGEKLRSYRERQTWVATLQGSSWKIVHCHNSLPIDMSTGKARSEA